MFYIADKTWNKIMNYSHAAYDEYKSEIGGMLVAIQDDDDDWVLQDPVILKQTVSGGNCVLNKDELAKYYTKVGVKLKNKDFRFVWWHSHHTMAAYFSPTDDTAIEEYSDGDFSFALVVNLRGEYKFRISVWQPQEIHKDVELEFSHSSKKVPNAILKEVNDLCNKPTQAQLIHKSAYTGLNDGYSYVSPDYRQMGMFEYETTYNKAYDCIDDLNKDIILGSINYRRYAAKIRIANAQLKQANSGIEITLLPELDIVNKLVCMQPGDLLVVEEGKDPYATMKAKEPTEGWAF